MKLGVRLESMQLRFRAGLEQVAQVGATGLQVDALGDFSPDQLTETGRREIRNLFKSFNLELTALNCPLRRGLDVVDDQQKRLEYLRKVLSLAVDLGPRRVVLPFPVLPKEGEETRASILRDSILDLGRHADRIGGMIAFEIGFDSPENVEQYLQSYDCAGLQINYDPANLLIHGHDPIRGVMPLHSRIIHVHARDARRATISSGGQEVRLGAGDIDWLSMIASLASIEYRGFLTIEREGSPDPMGEISQGIKFLKRMMLSGS